MSGLAGWLAEGDLRADGYADEAVRLIYQHPELAADLLTTLEHTDTVVRAHGADALEKLARTRPDLLKSSLPQLITAAERPEPAAVHMHLAMILGHLAVYPELRLDLLHPLLQLLDSTTAFSRCWAISSLCILARFEPAFSNQVTDKIATLASDPSLAVRTRARKAIPLLLNRRSPFPKGWIKSDHLRHLEDRPAGSPDPSAV